MEGLRAPLTMPLGDRAWFCSMDGVGSAALPPSVSGEQDRGYRPRVSRPLGGNYFIDRCPRALLSRLVVWLRCEALWLMRSISRNYWIKDEPGGGEKTLKEGETLNAATHQPRCLLSRYLGA